MWSVQNPVHELAIQEVVEQLYPELSIHLSHAVAPYVGEYERCTTTVIDAYVAPLMNRFLRGFDRRLRDEGFGGQIVVAQADGGSVDAESTKPVATLHSGPAAGVIASQREGSLLGYDNVITTDVGGTSFDVAVVRDGRWVHAREPIVGKFNLALPMIEVESVGAGGGSIAWVDEVGGLHVGPRSAGAVPGPACYGLGGTEPTVTDAAVVLGYINPDYFLGGHMTISAEAATDAVARLGEQLNMDTVTAAEGVFRVVNAHMADLLTRRVVARGHDPRDFVLFAYGGAGGMHCAFYGAEAGVREVIVPAHSGTFSAVGVATAPILHNRRTNDFAPMPMDPERFNANFRQLRKEIVAELDQDAVDQREIVYALEMRYGDQVHTVRLEISEAEYDADGLEDVSTQFDREYESLYGRGSGYKEAGRFVTGFTVDGYGSSRSPSVTHLQWETRTHPRQYPGRGAFTYKARLSRPACIDMSCSGPDTVRRHRS